MPSPTRVGPTARHAEASRGEVLTHRLLLVGLSALALNPLVALLVIAYSDAHELYEVGLRMQWTCEAVLGVIGLAALAVGLPAQHELRTGRRLPDAWAIRCDPVLLMGLQTTAIAAVLASGLPFVLEPFDAEPWVGWLTAAYWGVYLIGLVLLVFGGMRQLVRSVARRFQEIPVNS